MRAAAATSVAWVNTALDVMPGKKTSETSASG